MSFIFNKSMNVTGPVAMYNLISCLESAGWVQMEAGDGTSYFAPGSGTYITSGLATTNGLGNNNAWTRIQDPSGTREFTIQRTTANTSYRIKYSLGAKFISVAGDNNSTPAATDEVVLWGTGTDAAPGGSSFFSQDKSYKYNVAADNAPPYGFWAAGFTTPYSVLGVLCLDPLVGCAATDAHNYILILRGSSYGLTYLLNYSTNASAGNYLNYSTLPSVTPNTWLQYPALMLALATGSTLIVTARTPTDNITQKDLSWPMIYGRSTAMANPGYKGVSTIMKWVGNRRARGTTLSISTTKDRIVYDDVSFPWDGTDPDV
jgi:hypothetical protein